ncbi:MAG TPA: hypothetical protein VFV50_05220, partial [Bdellovibrionales bacterium]|nr:hypothetical protein [Bdellovibrionales bacterium]
MEQLISTSIIVGFGWIAFAVVMVLWLRHIMANSGTKTSMQVAQKENERLEQERNRLYLEKESLQRELMAAKEQLAAVTTQKAAYENAREQLEQTFQALASKALHGQAETFLKLASERLDKKTTEAKG